MIYVLYGLESLLVSLNVSEPQGWSLSLDRLSPSRPRPCMQGNHLCRTHCPGNTLTSKRKKALHCQTYASFNTCHIGYSAVDLARNRRIVYMDASTSREKLLSENGSPDLIMQIKVIFSRRRDVYHLIVDKIWWKSHKAPGFYQNCRAGIPRNTIDRVCSSDKAPHGSKPPTSLGTLWCSSPSQEDKWYKICLRLLISGKVRSRGFDRYLGKSLPGGWTLKGLSLVEPSDVGMTLLKCWYQVGEKSTIVVYLPVIFYRLDNESLKV